MIKILNAIFGFLKYILIFVAFGLTLYIMLGMYMRLNKSMISAISIFIPYLVLLILFCINIFKRQKGVLNNTFYNITCVLAFTTIIFVAARAIWDTSMVLNSIMGYKIDFAYFSDFIVFMKTLLYGLSIANICFMFVKDKDSKEVEVL
jgi:hypothetical protein